MVDVRSKQSPEWLTGLRDPILGDLRLSPYIVAPDYIPKVLKAFGEQHAPARRWIVVAIDEMAIKLWFAKRNAPKKFSAADANDLERLENAARNFLSQWSKASPYYPALVKAMVLVVPPKERRNHTFEFSSIDPGSQVARLLPVIRALRSQEIYSRAFSQPPSSHKALERALLWEPLFDLLHEFKIKDFGKRQPLIETIRSLHLACGIQPPEPGAVRTTLNEWRKRQR